MCSLFCTEFVCCHGYRFVLRDWNGFKQTLVGQYFHRGKCTSWGFLELFHLSMTQGAWSTQSFSWRGNGCPFTVGKDGINFVHYFAQTHKGKGTSLISVARKIRYKFLYCLFLTIWNCFFLPVLIFFFWEVPFSLGFPRCVILQLINGLVFWANNSCYCLTQRFDKNC